MKIPGSDGVKNIYNAFNLGFSLKPSLPRLGSFSGITTAAGFIGTGAALGAGLGSQMEGDMTGTGAAIGAAAGAVALPAIGLATRGGYEIGKRAIPALGSAVMKAPAVGAAALRGGINLATHAPFAVMPKIGQAAAGFSSMMVDWDNTKKGKAFLESVKFTNPISGAKIGAKAGWASGKTLPGKLIKGGIHSATGAVFNGQTVLWGSSVIAGAAGAFNEMNRAHMGQMDGQITRPTPRVPYYENNGGATGDLVFALNANRRG